MALSIGGARREAKACARSRVGARPESTSGQKVEVFAGRGGLVFGWTVIGEDGGHTIWTEMREVE